MLLLQGLRARNSVFLGLIDFPIFFLKSLFISCEHQMAQNCSFVHKATFLLSCFRNSEKNQLKYNSFCLFSVF